MAYQIVQSTGDYPVPFNNAFVRMQHGEKQRILQEAKNWTKRKAYQECLMPGTHSETLSEGHTVQEAVMRQNGMCDEDGNVRSFIDLPMDLRQSKPKPVLLHVNHAGTGYFSCSDHEPIFREIELPRVPDFDDQRHLTLFAYKAILGGLWLEKLLLNSQIRQAELSPDSTFPTYMCDAHAVRVYGKEFCKNVAEKQLELNPPPSAHDNESNEFGHKVFVVPSPKPMVAVSGWCAGERFLHPHGTNELIHLPLWGCSIYPRSNDHVVMYHYLKTDEAAIIRNTRFSNYTDERRLQSALSRDILQHLEAVIISAPGWNEFTPEQQEGIRDFFMSTPDSMGLEFPDVEKPKPVDEWHSKDLRMVNLFVPVG